MDVLLNSTEIRILGSLIEKQITTPDYYPLTLNSLVSACNQKSARNPVTEYSEEVVHTGLDGLREKKLALRVDTAGGRVPKFRHQLETVFELEKKQIAALTILMLRGPQTLGEIRARSERLYLFRDLAEVDETLSSLIQLEEPHPLATELPREPGRKERRYAQLLEETPDQPEDNPTEETVADTLAPVPTVDLSPIAVLQERVAQLEKQNTQLSDEVNALKSEFSKFKEQFE